MVAAWTREHYLLLLNLPDFQDFKTLLQNFVMCLKVCTEMPARKKCWFLCIYFNVCVCPKLCLLLLHQYLDVNVCAVTLETWIWDLSLPLFVCCHGDIQCWHLNLLPNSISMHHVSPNRCELFFFLIVYNWSWCGSRQWQMQLILKCVTVHSHFCIAYLDHP